MEPTLILKMSKEKVRLISAEAVDRFHLDKGLNHRFAFDEIWDYAEELVPSLQRPTPQKFLVKEGYIEKTGGSINAKSEPRAGSPTPEYRFGKHYRISTPVIEIDSVDNIGNLLVHLAAVMSNNGFIISASQLANFYLAMKTSPLIILSGISGTGKSKLPRLFAYYTNALFKLISVQPQWSDNTDLFGYTPSLNPDIFIPGKFTEFILDAITNKTYDKLAIVLLDEMNLAPVEHYFSDFLSIAESRRKENSLIVTDQLPLDLPPTITRELRNRYEGLRLPANVRIVGTANMDETTRMFSPKVIDRVFNIEFTDIDLLSFADNSPDYLALPGSFSILGKEIVNFENPISVGEIYQYDRAFFDDIATILSLINGTLLKAGISFGYRTRDIICLYLWHWKHDKLENVLPLKDAFDLCILQKILPKISGTGEILQKTLEELRELLQQESIMTEGTLLFPCVLSADKLSLLLRKLNDDGAVSYWGI